MRTTTACWTRSTSDRNEPDRNLNGAPDESSRIAMERHSDDLISCPAPTIVVGQFRDGSGLDGHDPGATAAGRGVPVNDPGWDYDPTGDVRIGCCYLTQNANGNTDGQWATTSRRRHWTIAGGSRDRYAYACGSRMTTQRLTDCWFRQQHQRHGHVADARDPQPMAG